MAVSLLVVGNFNERRRNLQYHGFHAEFKEKRPVVSSVIRSSLKDHLQDKKIPQAPYSIEPSIRASEGMISGGTDFKHPRDNCYFDCVLLNITAFWDMMPGSTFDTCLPQFRRNLLLLLLFREDGGSRFLRNPDKYLPQ
jgi:hypothetical protein